MDNQRILQMLGRHQAADAPLPLRMVLDTDTYNEVDDQFALCYALSSKERLRVEAIYAAPFHNDRSSGPEDGMERSYDEILRLLGLMNLEEKDLAASTAPATSASSGAGSEPRFVFKGSRRYLTPANPEDSPACADLIRRARASAPEDPLYVVAIGAITNVANALLLAPEIARNIVVVWLGGHAPFWPDTREFNLIQDVPAARVVLDSGAALAMLPVMGVVSHLHTTVPELEHALSGCNPLCDSLVQIVRAYPGGDRFAWSKVIWDISAVAYLVNPGKMRHAYVPAPIVTSEGTWSFDAARHLIDWVQHIDRDVIFGDVFEKLRAGKWA